ncbi:MAG: large subunit ribosomal protein L22 [Alphaproteobacteria bacterium]|jgi:large subunit ribosomal protein L22
MHRKNFHELEPIATAKSPMIKGSVQKINLVLKAIRGKTVMQSLSILSATRKYAAIDIRKTLLSAISNAEKNGVIDIDSLIVKRISAGKSVKLRRFQPRARGRIFSVNKHYSKIYIELHDQVEN